MSYYNFKKGVYLVEGHVNGCLYDLNTRRLYAINTGLKEALNELIQKNRLVDEDFTSVRDYLVEQNILEAITLPGELRDIKEIGRLKEIDFAWIKVTDKCNLTCIHCFEEASPECTGEIDFEGFKKVIQELSKNNIPLVQLYGGEPLLLQDKLVQMIEYSTKYINNVEIFTNGTLINDEWIEVFKKYKVVVRFSLHSFNEKDHEQVTTVKGSYEKVMNAMRLLKQNGISHSFTMVEMKGVDLGEERTVECPVVKVVVRMTGRADLRLLNQDLVRKKLITQSYFEKPLDLERLKISVNQHNCFCKQLYIDTDLNVYPCTSVAVKELRHGNLKEQSLLEILKKEIMEFNKDKVYICNQCEYRYACFDCRIDSLDGDIYGKPWYCTYDPLKGEWEDEGSFVNRFTVD